MNKDYNCLKMDEQGNFYEKESCVKGTVHYNPPSRNISESSNGLQKNAVDYKEPVNIRDSFWKWVMLLMSSIVLSANFFCYDNPASIEVTLESEFGIS